MKFVGLNGREYQINFARDKKESQSSKLQAEALKVLKKHLPSSPIYEEVILRGCNNLVADFMIPTMGILVEVHGRQHYEFSKFFHKDKASFERYQSTDALKKEWCEIK
jgi:very-short-patch-repair endonuclease